MRTIEIPADQCMFALLDAPQWRGRQARAELLYQFEALLPGPIESFHAVFSEPLEGRVVACACDRGRLGEVRARFEQAVPESLPTWLRLDDPDAVRSHLNLLTGPAVPLARLQRERATAKLVCFCAIALLLLVWLGVQRRAQRHAAESERISGQIAELYDAVLPPAGSSSAEAATSWSNPAPPRAPSTSSRTHCSKSPANRFRSKPRSASRDSAIPNPHNAHRPL